MPSTVIRERTINRKPWFLWEKFMRPPSAACISPMSWSSIGREVVAWRRHSNWQELSLSAWSPRNMFTKDRHIIREASSSHWKSRSRAGSKLNLPIRTLHPYTLPTCCSPQNRLGRQDVLWTSLSSKSRQIESFHQFVLWIGKSDDCLEVPAPR